MDLIEAVRDATVAVTVLQNERVYPLVYDALFDSAVASCDLDELTKGWFGPGESQNVLFSDKNRVK